MPKERPSREELLRVLCECSPCTWEDLLSRLGDVDKRAVRAVLAEMIREGVLEKRPDYERAKLVYVATACSDR